MARKRRRLAIRDDEIRAGRQRLGLVLAFFVFGLSLLLIYDHNITGYVISEPPTVSRPTVPLAVLPPAAEEFSSVSLDEVLVRNRDQQKQNKEKNKPPSIVITEPDGGEEIDGESVEIWWKSEDGNNDLLLVSLEYYSYNRDEWTLIGEYFTDDRMVVWPIGGLGGGEYKLRAFVTDGQSLDSDQSRKFSLT